MSENNRGAAHPMTGRKHSEESLAKMRATQKRNAKPGAANPLWKGGSFLSKGYRMRSLGSLTTEERAIAQQMTAKGRAYLPEHRLVMAMRLGRPLLSSEVVHHFNGVKTDNRIENLELLDDATHKREHKRIDRELRALRAENERLREALSKCSCGMSLASG